MYRGSDGTLSWSCLVPNETVPGKHMAQGLDPEAAFAVSDVEATLLLPPSPPLELG